MELRTYTGLWKVERRLYKFYDINLPYPVSIRQIGLFLGSIVPWMLLMSFLHVPFAPPFGQLIWLFPPALFTWYANRPVAEGKTLFEYAGSQISFFTKPRVFGDLNPIPKNPAVHYVHGRAWRSKSVDDKADPSDEDNKDEASTRR